MTLLGCRFAVIIIIIIIIIIVVVVVVVIINIRESLDRYREVTGSNPVEVLNFSGFFTQLQKLLS